MRCRGVSREVSVMGEVSAPADRSRRGVGRGVDGLRAVEPQGGSQWRGANQAQRPGRRGPQHALAKRGHTAQSRRCRQRCQQPVGHGAAGQQPMERHRSSAVARPPRVAACPHEVRAYCSDDTTVKLLPLQCRTFWRDIFGLYED